jgi:hypothetical protein
VEEEDPTINSVLFRFFVFIRSIGGKKDEEENIKNFNRKFS